MFDKLKYVVNQQLERINDNLIRAYLKSLGGTDCFSPDDSAIKELEKEGYVNFTVCNKDKKSKHDAKTCKVQLAWLTETGKKEAEIMLQQILSDRIVMLRKKIGIMNPRIAAIVRYLLLKWAIWCMELPKNDRRHMPIYLDNHSGSSSVWGFSMPHFRTSNTDFLPEVVKNEITNTQLMLEDLALASKQSVHNRERWSSSSLVTVQSVAIKIAEEFWGAELPWPIDLLIHSLYKAKSEMKLAFGLDYSKLYEKDLSEHLQNASLQELAEFLFILHTTFRSYEHQTQEDPINWKRIREILPEHYGLEKENLGDPLVRRILGGIKLESLFEYRYDAIIAKVRKCISGWLETGTVTIEADIPDWTKIWELTQIFGKQDVIEELKAYYEKIKPI